MSELRGHFVLKGHDFVWHDGLIARAWRLSHTHPQGVLVVLNEIDHAGADVQSFLHNALENPAMARMDLPGDETISPAVGKVIYVGTVNGRAEDLPDALRDRFPVTIEMPTPNPQALPALPPDLRTLATNAATSKDRDRRISPRIWISDGAVTGVDEMECAVLSAEALRVQMTGRVRRLENLSAATEHFSHHSGSRKTRIPWAKPDNLTQQPVEGRVASFKATEWQSTLPVKAGQPA